jgi:AraC-like DNA-binding protein
VADLARRAGLSPSHFTAAHRQFFGENPKRFLLDTRLAHACHLLTNQALTVSEVAERAGFSSVFHFSRCFKRLMGCPPSRYQSSGGRARDRS